MKMTMDDRALSSVEPLHLEDTTGRCPLIQVQVFQERAIPRLPIFAKHEGLGFRGCPQGCTGF